MKASWRLARVIAGLTLASSILAVAPSCTDESIVLATVPATDAGTPVSPVRCIDQSACPTGTFCSKTACTDTTGQCLIFPAFCDPTENPFCGCDQITYFNDCLRQAAGVAASTMGQCQFDVAVSCGGDQNLACPDATQTCAQLLGNKGDCPPSLPGTCWVLPSSCPTAPAGADRWNSCADDKVDCVDTCTAITSGGIYRRAPPCLPPPPQQ